jgi:hypothetical protein
MRKLMAALLLAGAVVAAAHVRQTAWTLVIPKALTYPSTTLTFSSSAFSRYSHQASGDIRVKFDDPSWAASVSSARWITTGGGTYFRLTCKMYSTTCMQATKGTGTYVYALAPFTEEAPQARGRYELLWDVNPPGDTISDGTSGVPEIDPTASFAALAFVAGAALMIRTRRKK